jgi:hypothetical protein
MRPLRRAGLVLAFALFGCTDAANTQYLPIGSHCTESSACGTPSYACATAGYAGGYCVKDCVTDGDCPKDAVCFAGKCHRRCGADTQCRASEGYHCVPPAGVTAPVCVPASVDGTPDGGATD